VQVAEQAMVAQDLAIEGLSTLDLVVSEPDTLPVITVDGANDNNVLPQCTTTETDGLSNIHTSVVNNKPHYKIPTQDDNIPPPHQLFLDPDDSSKHKGHFDFPPDREDAKLALRDITLMLSPLRASKDGQKRGYKHFKGDQFTHKRLMMMQALLQNYTTPCIPHRRFVHAVKPIPTGWIEASINAAHAFGRKPGTAAKLRKWCRMYIKDRNELPFNPYGLWTDAMLEHGELAKEIFIHLQSIGKYVKAQDVVDYLALPEVKARHRYTNTISVRTAQRWMLLMEFRWGKAPWGQYIDGHEREDVIAHCQKVFLPIMARLMLQMRYWKVGQEEVEANQPPIWPLGILLPESQSEISTSSQKRVVIWYHDESTFYANDRRKTYWQHKTATAVPEPKGEGKSCMAVDFISADYGWLQSPDGKEATRILFRAGKNRDGYFSNQQILEHTEAAMNLLQKHYPDEQHVFVFDNASTHQKRADDALSARTMPKKPSNSFGMPTPVLDDKGQPIFDEKGKKKLEKISVQNGRFADGTEQDFYFPDDHPKYPGWFKGMANILEERGITTAWSMSYQCPGFKCPEPSNPDTRCCCRRALYNQPDFIDVKSAVAEACERRGFIVLFLPKFHPELNFIEQCWGYAKRVYRQYPLSKSEDELVSNVDQALDSIPLVVMRRQVQFYRYTL
jgi:hypothetical protein